MYSLSMSEAKRIHQEQEASQLMNSNKKEEMLKDDGLAMKRSALTLQSSDYHQLVGEEEEVERKPETEFLKSLSTKQKKELLK